MAFRTDATIELKVEIKPEPGIDKDDDENFDYIIDQTIGRLDYVEFGIVRDNKIIAYVHFQGILQ